MSRHWRVPPIRFEGYRLPVPRESRVSGSARRDWSLFLSRHLRRQNSWYLHHSLRCAAQTQRTGGGHSPWTYYSSGLRPACRRNDWAANGDSSRRNTLRFFNPTLSMPVQEVRLADLSENLKVTTINNDLESDTVKERTNIWEIAKSVSAIASAVVIPVVLLLASNEFSSHKRTRDTRKIRRTCC